MKHSVLHKRGMLEWVQICADEGRPMPDDAAIMDRFGFATPELARTLLADLADAGRIRVRGAGAARTIEIGARPPSVIARAIAEPAVRRPVAPTRIDLIRSAAARLAARGAAGAARADVSPIVPPVAVAAAPAAAPVVAPAPAPVKDRPMPTAPVLPVLVRPAAPGEKRQVTFTATGVVLDRLIAAAVAADSGIGPATLAIVTRAVMTGPAAAPPPEPEPPQPPDGKPRLSAGVLRAWRASGLDFGDFLTTAIERGVIGMGDA